ncbi:uncharacterized CRM domain-containing protein At3g25440, chloroplastic [Cucumis melo]|uniref:Uncharacterized CRM domain-containing protein At3g25440, chloroplastic n=1 Tax=Cucumis melo TaxID=3656 RepID=A0ABM3KQR7_CUCME|nr:uncharacterized CRM domain-containing protein At3g25440, chloroplastic [Cucumis melo]XP_050940132.1 uncharacterized CRM domain-containing protein At3g25440, chloroplastic [Cucumis melo]XP_050940136.1 uncharacterized CRM domain-containing protein At3g25440, chloroplastic [Cucumis melo]
MPRCRGQSIITISRGSLFGFTSLIRNASPLSLLSVPTSFGQSSHGSCEHQASSRIVKSLNESTSRDCPPGSSLTWRYSMWESYGGFKRWQSVRHFSNAVVELKTDSNTVRFSFGPSSTNGSQLKQKKVAKTKLSKKDKLNELRLYRLKAKKKKTSPNPEVRIRYSLEKAKRKEAWLIEKLRKFEIPKSVVEKYDPEILTEEEKHYLKRTGEKKKNFVLLGRRGVFGGVVLNMHMHWKKHETVKVICKPCKPGQVHEYAEELSRLSKGIVIDIKPNNSIIFYRGKNYVQPEVMSPPDTLSKDKALEKYRYEQSLEHTSQFIEKLEKELEDFQKHLAQFKRRKEDAA